MRTQTLQIKDLSLVRALELAVAKEVGEERYVPLSERSVSQSLKDGTCIGSFINDQLIGICIGFTELDDLNLFTDKIQNSSALTAGNFIRYAYVVSSKARGKGITKNLLSESLAVSRSKNLEHALATVAVNNGPSIKILLDTGFQITYVGPVYGDKIRYVSYQELKKFSHAFSVTKWILSTDLETQKELLQNGFRGIYARKEDENTFIGYCEKR